MAEQTETTTAIAQPEPGGPPAPENPVKGLDSANWALGVLADADRRLAEAEALYRAAKSQLDAWLEDRVGEHEAETEYLRSGLETWGKESRELILGKGKKKSRSLPHGTLKFRTSGGLLRVNDAKALVAWAKDTDVSLYREVPAPEVKAIQDYYARQRAAAIAAGEEPPAPPPGTTWEPETETFSFEPDSGLALPAPKEKP